VLQSWADGEWFVKRPTLADKISLRVFKVTGETNTDDLSPAPDAWISNQIPKHLFLKISIHHPLDWDRQRSGRRG
ncbi:aconitase B, partial [Pseudomonas sp. GM78]